MVLDVSAQQGTSVSSANQQEGQTVGRQQVNSSLTYFLALRPADVERVVQSSKFASLYVSLTAEDAPPAGDTPGSDGGSVGGPVSADSAAQPAQG